MDIDILNQIIEAYGLMVTVIQRNREIEKTDSEEYEIVPDGDEDITK